MTKYSCVFWQALQMLRATLPKKIECIAFDQIIFPIKFVGNLNPNYLTEMNSCEASEQGQKYYLTVEWAGESLCLEIII